MGRTYIHAETNGNALMRGNNNETKKGRGNNEEIDNKRDGTKERGGEEGRERCNNTERMSRVSHFPHAIRKLTTVHIFGYLSLFPLILLSPSFFVFTLCT